MSGPEEEDGDYAREFFGAYEREADRSKWADLFGIDPDYTEGMDIGAWLEEQRGEA